MGAELVWSSDAARTLRWGMHGAKKQWVLSTVDTGTLSVRMWRSVPDWLYTRDGMGYRKVKTVSRP